VNDILGEAETCRRANPDNHVRLIGYDNLKQTQGASMVILRG
jgi:ribulose-bisphosphate carboxylase small chain